MAKVALEAIRCEATIAEPVMKHRVHQALSKSRKLQAIEGIAGAFSGKAEAVAAERESELEKLLAKIGQLVDNTGSFGEGLLDDEDRPEARGRRAGPRSCRGAVVCCWG